MHRGYTGGCQNYGLFLNPYYTTAPNTQGTQKGTIILTTTHNHRDLIRLGFPQIRDPVLGVPIIRVIGILEST